MKKKDCPSREQQGEMGIQVLPNQGLKSSNREMKMKNSNRERTRTVRKRRKDHRNELLDLSEFHSDSLDSQRNWNWKSLSSRWRRTRRKNPKRLSGWSELRVDTKECRSLARYRLTNSRLPSSC